MSIIIDTPNDVESLSLFLEEMNLNEENHIGYCGASKTEIFHTILHNFSDLPLSKSFVVAYKNEEIIGALGFDLDIENKSAEVWGPFIKSSSQYPDLSDALWKKINSLSTFEFNEFSFFINKKNIHAQQFALAKKAARKGNHLILKALCKDLVEIDLRQVRAYNPSYQDSFTRLHENAFPNTYFSATEILKRLGEDNQLFITVDTESVIKGYVYVEADPAHKEGAIEYIAVSDDHRKQGIGTKLLRAALAHLSRYKSIKEITISVNIDNEKAIKLYNAAGFVVMHELIHYIWKKEEEK
ncbi:N-acetyltransferase [Bacillus sp. FJAT-22090]|uniref:GNAT family N-acetyltransferase n=1 Tax=Bacillus sp. FJAT-22090 TaxID=1581038 RepID=UPI0011A2DD37|nr:N-acetyltransferase [Bacillus sp. FJAT-22090]